jgi:ribose transport system permease protein
MSANTSERPSRSFDLGEVLNRYGVLFALVLIPVFFSIVIPSKYFTVGNLQTILSTQSVLVMLTLGLTITLVVNEFDLSIGGAYALSAMVLAVLTARLDLPLWVGILAALGVGVGVGLINALLVVVVGVNSFIATLGAGTVLFGLTLLISGSTIISGVPRELVTAVSGTKLAGVSLSVFYAIALGLILWFVYEKTKVGRYLYFTGFNPSASRLSGIKVNRLRVGAFVGTATVAALAGIVQTGTLGAADPTAGQSVLLPTFAAAYLGSTMIRPGRFNAIGALLAVYFLISGITGLQLLGLSGWTEQVFNGVALVAAVTFARLASRRRDRQA